MTIADLRVYEPAEIHRDTRLAYCPACRCRKSGYATEPNGRDPSCIDHDCSCHDEAR